MNITELMTTGTGLVGGLIGVGSFIVLIGIL